MKQHGDDFDVGDLRSLIEHLPVVTYREVAKPESYPDASIIYLSPQIKDMTGYSVEEFKQSPSFSYDVVVHPDDREAVMSEAQRTISTGEVYRQEYRVIHKDGHVVWGYDVSRLVHEDEDGTQVWDGVTIDITEQKEAEEALRASESKYRDLVERIPATVYTMAGRRYGDARFVYLNPAMTAMGYDAESYLRDPDFWKQVVHPDDVPMVEEETKAAMDSGHAYALEYREYDSTGSMRWIRDEARVVHVEPDGTRMWQGFTFDITERKQAEIRLEETVALLRQTDKVRRELLAQLVRAEEAERARIAADLHDDSVQSLTALALRLDLLRTRMDPMAEAANEDVAQIREIVDQTVKRLREMMFDLRPRVLDAEGLAAALEISLARFETDSGISTSLANDLTGEPPADLRAILFRVARESLTNVRKHAGASRVEVELASTDHGTRVRIRDDGKGFDPQDLAVPEPGHLGFESMRERIESAGGRMVVNSRPGHGTTVELWVPGALPDAN